MRVSFGFSASSRRAPPYRLRGAPPPAREEVAPPSSPTVRALFPLLDGHHLAVFAEPHPCSRRDGPSHATLAQKEVGPHTPPLPLCEGGVRVGRGGEVGGYSKSSRCDDDVGMKFRGEGWRCACVCVGGGGGSKPTRRM